MKVLHFPLAKVSLCFMAGILFGHYFRFEPSTALLVLLGLLLLVTLLHFTSGRNQSIRLFFGLTVCLASFGSGVATQALHNGYLAPNHFIHHVKASGEKHELTVLLHEKIKSSARYVRYIGIVKSIDSQKSEGRILLHFSRTASGNDFIIGSNLKIAGPVNFPKPPDNPDQFDYGKYLVNKSIFAQMYRYDALALGGEFDKDAFYYADAIRRRILDNLKKTNFDPTALAVVAALILGQQQDISREVLHDYQFAGAIHILSVSGLHVGFILLFLNFVLDLLPKNRHTSLLKLCVIWFALWGFAVLAGLSPSVIRSVTMFSFVALGMHLKRQTNIFHTLLVSMLLILIFEPSFLFDIGFQLSYLALFFIVWLQPLLMKLYAPRNKIADYFWQLLTVSFAAQIGTLPLSLYYFHQFPGLFFVTNLVIIPFLGIIMGLGVVVMLLAAMNWMWLPLIIALEWSVLLLNKIIGAIASLESFIFKDIPFNNYMLGSLYILIVSLIICAEKPNFRKYVVAALALLLFESGYFGSKWAVRNQSEWIVFNARKTTVIAERNGETVTVHSNKQSDESRLLNPYLVANFCRVSGTKPLQNTFYFNSNKILLIDSCGLYPKNACPDILVLRSSPKINLNRLLGVCRPKIIVADASNFKSYVKRWALTCTQQKIPFHATAEKGFYKLK